MRAETFAEYDEHIQWAEDQNERPEIDDTAIHPVNTDVET